MLNIKEKELYLMIVVFILLFVLSLVISSAKKREEERKIKNKMQDMLRNGISPDAFFKLREKIEDFVGVYVIYNSTQNMYYVGQSKRVMFRVNQHFTGHGNGDVYADYKYKNTFYIKTIPLVNSGYSNIDKLEKDMIQKYDAYNKGYNRTRGNNK